MADTVDKATRGRMMAAIKIKDTKPEIAVRKALHAAGYRFRLYDRNLPGKPDLVLKKYKTVVFVHGCFWHGHECRNFKWPKSRPAFWEDKISGNRMRDKQHLSTVTRMGWTCKIVWECNIEKDTAKLINYLAKKHRASST